jgi:acetyltransferase
MSTSAGTERETALPYPEHLVGTCTLADGTTVTVRPIRATDAVIEQAFVRGLSDETRYYRFMDMLRELSPRMLKQLTDIDYHDRMALIATIAQGGHEEEIAVGRYCVEPGGERCEFAIVVADAWQRRGIATMIMRKLIDAARARGLRSMFGEILTSNHRMLHFVTKFGFRTAIDPEDQTLMRATLQL